MKRRGAAVMVGALVAAPGALTAQTGWEMEARGGELRTGPGAPASSSLGMGLRYIRPDVLLSFGGGLPMSGSGAVWGEAGAWKRLGIEVGPVFVGADLTGSGVLLQERVAAERRRPGFLGLVPGTSTEEEAARTAAAAGAVQAMPMVGVGPPGLRLEGRTGASYYVASMAGQTADRTVVLSDLALRAAPVPAVALESRLSRFGAPERADMQASLMVQLTHDRASLWASAGHWFSEQDEAGTPWSAGARIALSSRATLSASARRTTFDPLYLTPPQTAWSAGLSVALGPREVAAPPIPAAYLDGRATIRLPASEARGRPHVAGDFNDWRPEPMTRDGDAWIATFPMDPGVYTYAFVTADDEWYVPESVPGRRDDGMGGTVAVLVVQP